MQTDEDNKPTTEKATKAQEEAFNGITIINSFSKASHHGMIILYFLLKRNFISII